MQLQINGLGACQFAMLQAMLIKTYPVLWRWPLLSVIALWVVGCTSIGAQDESAFRNTEFGPEETLRICVLLDEPRITQQSAAPIIASMTQELAKYKIQVEVPWYRSWHRPSGRGLAIIEALAAEQLAPPCDRILALVGRNFGDFLVGTLFADELGSVDTVTSTRGYVAANANTVNQLFVPPSAAAVHEVYHLLGCQHDMSMDGCYARIGRLKEAAAENRANGMDFFPTYSRRGQLLMTRELVDVREAIALKVERAKADKNQDSQSR